MLFGRIFGSSSVRQLRDVIPCRKSGANLAKKKRKPTDSRKEAAKEAQRILQMRLAQIEASKPQMEENDPELLKPERQRPRSSDDRSEEETTRRFLLVKDWSRYQMEKHKEDMAYFRSVAKCRLKALKELRRVSEELYEKAMTLDKNILPLERVGPSETPPLAQYVAPDAEEDFNLK